MDHPSSISARPGDGETARADAEHLRDAQVARWTDAMARGERGSYESLFRAHCAFVERESMRALGRRRDLADDVAQEVWLRVARKPVVAPSVASLEAWLRRVVRSAAIDMLRSELSRRLREGAVARERAEAVRFLDAFEVFESLQREVDSIEGLTPEERALFELKARTDATTARLAGWLGLGAAAVDSRLRRAAERARVGTSETRGNS
jgi:RNA polymerase sigma-70 factor (ECF subfamily)